MASIRSTLSTAACVSLLLGMTPVTAWAAPAVTAEDSIAGLGADIVLGGLAPQTSYAVRVTPPSGQTLPLAAKTDAAGAAVVSLSAEDTQRAGRYRVEVRDGETRAAEGGFDVLPDALDARGSSVEADKTRIEADERDEATVTVTLQDRYGNPLAGRPVTLVSSRSSDGVYALDRETDAAGTQRFAVSGKEAGRTVLRAIDLLSGDTLSRTAEIQVGREAAPAAYAQAPQYAPYPPYPYAYPPYPYFSPFAAQAGQQYDIIQGFRINAPKTMEAGVSAEEFSVTAVDRNGRQVQDYAGTMVFDADDPDATLPSLGEYELDPSELGTKSFRLGLKFNMPGERTLRVSDKNDPTIFGETKITVTGEGSSGAKSIAVVSPENGTTLCGPDVVLRGTGPRNSDVSVEITSGPLTRSVPGSTESDGTFAVPLTLEGGQGGYNVRVEEKVGRGKSENIYLEVDRKAPELAEASFAPQSPLVGEKVLVRAKSDAQAAGVKVRLTNGATQLAQELDLEPVAAQPGVWQGFFTAPSAGDYQAEFIAVDDCANAATKTALLSAQDPAVPAVEEVRAQPLASAIMLEWDAPADDIEEYRIFIGEKADTLDHDFNTQSDGTQAKVSGLLPGRTYYFAVSALKGGRESARSDVAQAETLGLSLQISNADCALRLTWTDLAEDIPLASYDLEYGVGGEYTETRSLNGGMRSYAIRDLLDGIAYDLRLTPVTVTGERLAELAVTGQGTALCTGTPGSGDPLPFDPAHPPLHPGAPQMPVINELPPAGLPPLARWLGAVAVLGTGGVLWHLRRKARRQASFLNAIRSQYGR